MSMEALREAVAKSRTDTFEVGTVIRWVSSGRYNYAALKTPVGWYTTAASYNSYIDHQLTFKELLEVLAADETSEVMIASAWDPVTA